MPDNRMIGRGGEEDCAGRYAQALIDRLGVNIALSGHAVDHPALAWRRAGLMAATGRPDGPPLVCPAALASAADGALIALRGLAPDPATLPANGALLLGERARLMGLARGGRQSANRSCRLLDAQDGRIALNLARQEDWDLMPALLGGNAVHDWDAVAQQVAVCKVADLIALGIELGLPIAEDRASAAEAPFTLLREGAASGSRRRAQPLVVDFSALWAGPLAASLLGMMGAEIVKVESVARPDGARFGHAGFYDLLNAGKRSIAVDFSDADDLAGLRALVAQADIVIEASRPRALRRIGIDREVAVAGGCIWISITGHESADRVGFGDDAAVAGGLAAMMAAGWGEALFAGDAIADPLTGLHAALAAWALWRREQGALIHLSLANTTAFAMGAGVADRNALSAWQALALADDAPFYPLRVASQPARARGADTVLLADIAPR